MNTTRLLTGFIGLLLAGMLLSCEDHRSQVITPGANRLRVKKLEQQVTTASPSLTTVMDFAYDGQNRLSSITSYRTPDSTVAPVEKTLYQYDTQNRLTQVQHSEVRRGSMTETYTLSYNAAGQLGGLANSLNQFMVGFEYNGANQLTGIGKYFFAGGTSFSGGVRPVSFTGSNLTGVSEEFSIRALRQPDGVPPVYSRSLQATYTYDAAGINPFYGTFIIPAPGVFLPQGLSFGPFYTLYGGIDNFFNFSPRNVETAVVVLNGRTTTTTYTYTYNAVGLPTSRTTTTSNSVTEILRYEYEPY